MLASDPADRPEPSDFPPDPLLESGSFIFSVPRNAGTLGNGGKRRPSQPPRGVSPTSGAGGMSDGKDQANPAAIPGKTSSPADMKTRKPGVPESWLPPGWTVEDRIRTSGFYGTKGRVDKYYHDPSGRMFRSKNEVLYFLEHGTPKKQKRTENTDPSESQGGASKDNKFTPEARTLNFDFLNAPEKINWVLTNTSEEESWTPFIGEKKVPESSTQDWAAAFTMVTTRNGVQITS